MKKLLTHNFLRIITLIILLIGAIGSLIFMFRAGHKQSSLLLIILFTAWVLSPFLAVFIADAFVKRCSIFIRIAFCFLAIFITLGSLISYSGALDTPDTKNAFKFLIVPLMSWLFILILLIVASRSRKLSINGKNQTSN